MTHKPPQGIDAGLRDASFKAFSDYVKKLCAILDEEGIETEQIDCDLHNLAENLLVKQMLGTLIAQPRTAPPEPRKDLAALEEAQIRLDEAEWWDDNCGFPGRGAKMRADRLAELEQRLAEMRGAKEMRGK